MNTMNTNNSSPSILLAEDNIINQKVAMLTLKKLGLEADIAENGLQAIEMYKKKKYDIILMDIQMPEMDGLDATQNIRLYETETSCANPVRIIAMTANALREDRTICINAGMNEYVSKPFNLEEVKRVIFNF